VTLTRSYLDTTTHDQRDDIEMTCASRDVSIILWSRNGIETVELVAGQRLVVGRSEPADVRLRDRSLSRLHAEFRNVDGRIWARDLQSRNGTMLDGRRVNGETEVRPGDELRLGSVVAQVRVTSLHAGVRGIDPLDRFLSRLEEEVLRTRLLGGTLSLLEFRSLDAEHGPECNWRAALRQALRPVDGMATYGRRAALVLLPEIGLSAARDVANDLIKKSAPESLVCAIASCPAAGRTQDQLLATVHDLSRRATTAAPVLVADPEAGLADGAHGANDEPDVVVAAPSMQKLHALVVRAATTDAPVLILGETGAGKELIAAALHRNSPRRDQRLLVVNCAALPATLIESLLFGHERGAYTGADRQTKGIFEQAEGGTVFLDEIGELSTSVQAVLLRILESKRLTRLGASREIAVDVRIVAATNRNLEAMVASGEFRADLYWRLNTIPLCVPPLRERREEIKPLAELFLRRAREHWRVPVSTIHEKALERLQGYSWPGNVRELKNVIEHAVIVGGGPELLVEHLPERAREVRGRENFESVSVGSDIEPYWERVKSFEAAMLRDALRRNGGNRTKAAAALRMPLRTLMTKLKTFGVTD
jgi:two-component system, NtrC family, response regulator AtoC